MYIITQCIQLTLQLWSALYHILFIQFIYFSLLSVLEIGLISFLFPCPLSYFNFLHSQTKGPWSIFLGSSSSFRFWDFKNKRKETTWPIPFESKWIWDKLIVFLLSFSRFSPFFFLYRFFFYVSFVPLVPAFSLLPSKQLFNLLSSSQLSLFLSLTHSHRGICSWLSLNFCQEKGRGERTMHLLETDFGKRKGHIFSPPCIYTPS